MRMLITLTRRQQLPIIASVRPLEWSHDRAFNRQVQAHTGPKCGEFYSALDCKPSDACFQTKLKTPTKRNSRVKSLSQVRN